MAVSPDCRALLRRVQELEFVAIELNLYLDTHPTENRVIEEYNRVTRELMDLVQRYDRTCGPHMGFGHSENSGSTWLWAMQPWPWEI